LVRLSANQLEQVPPWLLKLPRLAWLALAGNPLGWDQPMQPRIAQVPWHALQLKGLLGEGASGHIYQVQHTGGGVGREETPAQTSALKLFKGALTSDGLPEHELAASLAAGQHPALCTPHGELVGHPQGTRGLLLPLIPAHYINLAAPPSLDSCTRDVYAPDLQMGAALALRVAAHIASAVAHLHQQGVVHGDVYAHNILWNPDTGGTMLGDFGAATVLSSSLSPNSVAINRSLKALEMRALGCLFQELHDHVMPDAQATLQLAELAQVAQACLNPCAAQRPSGEEVARQLSK
jgi:serine/threonine protein kinase